MYECAHAQTHTILHTDAETKKRLLLVLHIGTTAHVYLPYIYMHMYMYVWRVDQQLLGDKQSESKSNFIILLLLILQV